MFPEFVPIVNGVEMPSQLRVVLMLCAACPRIRIELARLGQTLQIRAKFRLWKASLS
jgi:hypothetical protein